MLKIDNANDYIELTTVYYDKNGAQHTKNIFYCEKRDIIKKAVNRFDLDLIGANNAALNLDNNKIFQIGGYTPENGLYCRLY